MAKKLFYELQLGYKKDGGVRRNFVCVAWQPRSQGFSLSSREKPWERGCVAWHFFTPKKYQL